MLTICDEKYFDEETVIYETEITFYSCSFLSIPSTLIWLTRLEFNDCNELTSIPNSLVNLETLCCNNCHALRCIPNTLINLTSLDFLECYSLESIPSTFTRLEELKCWDCPLITTIPSTLRRINEIICSNCPMLTSIPNNKYIDKQIYDCKWLYPGKAKMDNLIKVQRKCKKYIQRRRETIISSLIDYLPLELIIYCILA